MIISHHHRFIFVKTRKTGGTSIEIALSTFCGDDDVIAPITPIDELQRLDAGCACRNYSNDREREQAYLDELRENRQLQRLPKDLRSSLIYSSHTSLAEALALDPAIADYTVISLDRHPYSKAVSLADHRNNSASYRRGEGFNSDLDTIRAKLDTMADDPRFQADLSNWVLYSIDGVPRVDHFLRHESLAVDFEETCKALDLSPIPPLPQTKVSQRDRTVTAREILTPEQQELVQTICADEFDFFGYER